MGDDWRGRVGVRGQKTFMTEPSQSKVTAMWGLSGNGRVLPQSEEANGGHKPSFGRRAANAASTAQGDGGSGESKSDAKPTGTDPPPPPPSWLSAHPPEDKQLSGNSVLGGDSPSISAGRARGGLLPRRPKAEAAVMRSHDVMPGAAVSEPDDLEELVL